VYFSLQNTAPEGAFCRIHRFAVQRDFREEAKILNIIIRDFAHGCKAEERKK